MEKTNVNNLNISARVTPIPIYGDLLGVAVVKIADHITLRGVRIQYTDEMQLHVSLPGVTDGLGGEMDVCGISNELRAQIENTVRESYREALDKINGEKALQPRHKTSPPKTSAGSPAGNENKASLAKSPPVPQNGNESVPPEKTDSDGTGE